MVGRDEEIGAAAYAVNLTRSGAPAQPIIFTGLRGMGKTALLRRCVAEARKRDAIVVSAEAVRAEPLHESLRRGLDRAGRDVASLPKRLKTSLDAVMAAMPRASIGLPGDLGTVELRAREAEASASFADALNDLNVAVRRHDRALVFAVDELQDASVADLGTLVRFIHETAGSDEPVLLLGAGLPNSPAHLHSVRTYTERWRYFRIELLSDAQAMEAIAAPARDRGVSVEPRALERLAEETAGYPFFVQEYASAIWLHRAGKAITFEEVEQVVPGVRRTLESEFYEARFRQLTTRELAYALALASLGRGPHGVGEVASRLGSDSAGVSSVRAQLIKKDVVYAPAAGLVEFRIPLTERYVERHRATFEARARKR